MFQNVGKEIKGWAKFIVVLITVMFVLTGCIVVIDYGLPVMLLVGGILGVLGYFIGRLTAILLYAFGELVDASTEIKSILLRKFSPESYVPQKMSKEVSKILDQLDDYTQ